MGYKSTYTKKEDLVRIYARKLGITIPQAQHALNMLQETILEALDKNDAVKIADMVIIEKKFYPSRPRELNGVTHICKAYTGINARVSGKYKKLEEHDE